MLFVLYLFEVGEIVSNEVRMNFLLFLFSVPFLLLLLVFSGTVNNFSLSFVIFFFEKVFFAIYAGCKVGLLMLELSSETY